MITEIFEMFRDMGGTCADDVYQNDDAEGSAGGTCFVTETCDIDSIDDMTGIVERTELA